MTDQANGALNTERRHPRVIGRFGDGNGPTMIVMTGMHGNEPAGGRAAERLVARIEREGWEIHGEFVALSGNIKALEEKTRFIDRDFNRCWTPERVSRAESGDHPPFAEAEEMREVLTTIREIVARAQGPVYFLDCHTTSAEGPPFATVGDTIRNRRFARRFPLPLILGLEEQVDGALLEYLNNFGLVTLGVEAGQHDCDLSVDRFVALITLALSYTGLYELPAKERRRHTSTLRQASSGVPAIIEVRYRHAIHESDGFKMKPGYDNFVAIGKGEVVAQDGEGDVLVPEDGLMLLPLYQGKGNDGFFVARPVKPIWLALSRWLRGRRLGRLLPLLPGVRRSTHSSDDLVVNTKIARWYPLEVFHLFGYRKRRSFGTALVVSRRAFDLRPPETVQL